MKGKVKFYNQGKGFGFIAADDGKEYFVHQTALKEGVVLKENDEVTFDVVDGDRGPKASNVVLGSSEAASSDEQASSEE
ncbi:MAG: cold shock domain-containing protein [Nanoarchaeota archaeon]